MEETKNNSSLSKLWPLWVIIVVITIMILVNIGGKKANIAEGEKIIEQAALDETISAKALAMVPVQQFFMANQFGTKMPDFTVTTLSGEDVSLSSLAGKNVMFVFWATWCPPCRDEIPYIIRLREEIAADKLEIIAFSSERQAVVSDFVAASDINYKVAIGNPQSLPEPFNRVRALPTIFFIDPQGRLKIAVEGGISFQQMKGIIEAE